MSNHRIAAVWCRVSTQDQRELSLESQEVAVRKTLEAQGYAVLPQYVLKVDWSSMDLMSCPEFQQLQRWVTDGTIQAIGTLDRDRLQAQGLQRLLFLSECKDQEVPIITVQGPPMLDGGEGQLVELALALGKEKSVLRAQQGARDGLRDRVRLKGLPSNMKSPYGMAWQEIRLIPDDNYATVSEIWRMALTGRKLRFSARELTQRGIPTPSGRLGWRPSSIRYILKNRTYSGVIEALKTEAVNPTTRKTASYDKTGTRVRPQNERICLQGMVECPVVTEDEFEWVQEKLKENQRLAKKNTKLRNYLLRGRIRCATCGRGYIGVTRNNRSQYYCGGRWQPGPLGDRCQSPRFEAPTLEAHVYGMVQKFLQGAGVFDAEINRRHAISAESVENIQREISSLERQQELEQNAEAKAFRLAAHGGVSEDVAGQELGLIRTRRRWLAEQMDRLEQQLETIKRHSFTPESVGALRDRLEARLATATPGDQRFILEAVGTTVVAHADGTWELELQVPQATPEPVQIANSTPGFPAGEIEGCPLNP